MKLGRNSDVEAAFEGSFGVFAFSFAGFEVVVYGAVKVVQKFFCAFAFV